MRDPRNPREWQQAVDLARCWLVVESLQQYGLVTGGPVIDQARCLELLERGAALGYRPAPDEELLARVPIALPRHTTRVSSDE